MRIGIGIDTGGTSTDAVLIDLDTRAILDTSKALTTHYDLMAGILNALDGLNPELCRKAELAGLSTTLATNAWVESKARKSRLLLLGIDHQGIARNGARFGLNDPDDIRYLPCRTTIRGEVLEEPDWSVLRQHAREWFSDVEAVAVWKFLPCATRVLWKRRLRRSSRRKPACRSWFPVPCSVTCPVWNAQPAHCSTPDSSPSPVIF